MTLTAFFALTVSTEGPRSAISVLSDTFFTELVRQTFTQLSAVSGRVLRNQSIVAERPL